VRSPNAVCRWRRATFSPSKSLPRNSARHNSYRVHCVALLDVLSGGRVNWGAGRGFERSEFEAFGIAGEESASRFHETVDIVLKAWTNEKLSYEGKYYRYDGVEVLPSPFRRRTRRPGWRQPR
jgi:alkanesulfonate monooxygenase SsuD/methylene tetrahydromethanopterin reductase-like flavin-dependent oxidoreductase (luciferase family)